MTEETMTRQNQQTCGDCWNLHLRLFISRGWEGRRSAYGKGFCIKDPTRHPVFLGTACKTGNFSPRATAQKI